MMECRIYGKQSFLRESLHDAKSKMHDLPFALSLEYRIAHSQIRNALPSKSSNRNLAPESTCR